MNVSVAGLRKDGWKVCVIHLRDFYMEVFKEDVIGRSLRNLSAYRITKMESKNLPYSELSISSKGGKTVVLLTDPEGNESYLGESVCSENDQYNKKLGVRIALGRAISSPPIPKNHKILLDFNKGRIKECQTAPNC